MSVVGHHAGIRYVPVGFVMAFKSNLAETLKQYCSSSHGRCFACCKVPLVLPMFGFPHGRMIVHNFIEVGMTLMYLSWYVIWFIEIIMRDLYLHSADACFAIFQMKDVVALIFCVINHHFGS